MKQAKDPWDYIDAGEYSAAVRAYTKALHKEQLAPNYANRGMAYLSLGEPAKALADFQTAYDLEEYRSDAFTQLSGVALWLAGREAEAAKVWHDLVLEIEHGEIDYSDEAGGVGNACLLWFAAVRLQQPTLLTPARRLIKKLCNKNENWLGSIGQFLLGRIDEEQLRDAVSDIPVLFGREMCQAEFYIGIRALEAGRRADYRKAVRAAAKVDTTKIEPEYYLACHEGKRRERKPRKES